MADLTQAQNAAVERHLSSNEVSCACCGQRGLNVLQTLVDLPLSGQSRGWSCVAVHCDTCSHVMLFSVHSLPGFRE